MRFCSSTNSGPTVTYDASMRIGHIYSASSFTESDVWFFQSAFLSPNPNTKHTNVFLLTMEFSTLLFQGKKFNLQGGMHP